MRHYLRKIILVAVSLYLAKSLVPTIELGSDPKNILLIFGGLFVIFLIISPIFSIVLLPLNHLTFGLLLLILNIAFIFALLNYLPGFQVTAYNFPGALVGNTILPPYSFNQITTVLLVAFIITLTQKVLHIIFE